MFQRFLLLAAGLFCIVMNVLLWRMEFSGRQLGAEVPMETVLRRVLNSPEIAHLDIVQRRDWKRLGSFEWMMLVDEDAPDGGPEVEGMIRKVRGYTLDISQGNLLVHQKQVKFGLRTTFDPKRQWTSLNLTVQIPPRGRVSLNSRREEGTVDLDFALGSFNLKRELSFAQLGKLETLAALPAELTGDPRLAEAARQLTGSPDQSLAGARTRDTARAYYDWLPGIRHRLRVFRVNWTPAEGYTMVFYISLQGEILRVELPRGIVIRNRDYYG